MKVMLRATKISYVPEYLYFYRQNPNSIINTNKNREDIYKVIDIVEKFLKENNYYNEFKYEFDYFKVLQILQYILEADTEEYFNKALKVDENIGRAYIGLGEYYFIIGEYNKALVNFEKAIDMQEGTIDVYFKIALCYKALKQYEDALSYMNIVYDADPTNEIYIDELNQLETL